MSTLRHINPDKKYVTVRNKYQGLLNGLHAYKNFETNFTWIKVYDSEKLERELTPDEIDAYKIPNTLR